MDRLSLSSGFDDVLEEDSLEEDPFGDCFAAEETEDEGAGDGADGAAPKPEFRLCCPHNEVIERKRVFGFIDYQHQSDGKSCDILNKFNVKSAKVSEILAGTTQISIRDDALRAFLLTSPKKRKEYFDWMGQLDLYPFLAEVKLLDRFVVLRHGPDSSPYKLGVEVFKAFGKEIVPAIQYLFPNEEYLPNSVQRKMTYFRNLPDWQPAKVPVKCFQELEIMLQVKKDNEDMLRRAELGLPQTVAPNPLTNPLGANPAVPANPNVNAFGGNIAPGGGLVQPTTAQPSGPFAPVTPPTTAGAPLSNTHPAIGGGTIYFPPHNP